MIVVSDASPLILLSKTGLLTEAQSLFSEINITDAIFAEIALSDPRFPDSRELADAREKWLKVHRTPALKDLKPFLRRRSLSKADASVVALAKRLKATLVLVDDLALRALAEDEGFVLAGYAGILLQMKKKGLITSVRKPLDTALVKGFRLSKPLQESLLRAAGEAEAA